MPSTTVKNLYVAKCMKDLESNSSIESSIKKKATNTLVVSANKIFHAAEMSNLDMDEEKAYVQYARFVELVIHLKTRSDFKQNPEHNPLLLKANTALVKAEKLKTSLLKRYSILEEADCRTKNERNDLISAFHNKKPDVIIPAEPVIAKEEVSKPPEVVEHSISSSKLFELLTASMSSIVLMDVRSSHDFNESHIKHSCCVNVPPEILKPGTTALKLEQHLPEGSKHAWQRRDKTDYVILIDLDSSDETALSQPLEVLKLAMTKWDLKCTLKKPPLVLQGGYKDWMLKYPMYTTQALNYSFSDNSESSPVIADYSAIEYPSLDEPDKKVAANKENLEESGMLFKKSTFPPHTPTPPNSQPSSSNNTRNSKSAPSVDRKSKPTVDRGTKTALGERKHLNNNTITNHSSKGDRSIPSISNNLASATKNSDKSAKESRERELVSSLSVEEALAKESLELSKEQLAKEEEFDKLRLRKELAAEEGIRMEIQKREEQLLEILKQLEISSREKDATYLKIKEDNMKLKKQLEEKTSKESRLLKEKEIYEAEKTKRSVLESVERLREQRKLQELEKKKNELAKTSGLPREAVSANSGLKRNMSQQDQNSAQNSEYTIPLSRQSSSSGSGLVRSHSSPNIAQMVNQEQSPLKKMPTVDRSLKPKPSTPNYNFAEIHRARLRNLNPVHGVCSVRPATGLRNLGNTCFMNSIIQCLSNTKPFADYFTSGHYVEDINRDSKYGSGGEVVEEFAVVIRSLWMGQYKSVSPRDFKNTVSKCLSVCIGNEQQDSHEFLVVLMEKLHADLNRNLTRPIPKLESNADENAFWRHHKNYNSSVISDIFEGLLKSTLTCMSCRTTSDSFEVFSCLSLPILTNKCSLRDCFQNFLRPEKISGEAAWDCPKCKTKKEAEKRLRISRLPEILVIQLKRFSYEGLWRRKLQTNVDFDLHFNVPYEKNSEASYRKYSLYGVVNHFGTLEGGHYTAYCNNSSSQKWFKYDDHEVSEMSASDVKTPAGYLLFYRFSDVHSNL